jgi:hypothetical protein
MSKSRIRKNFKMNKRWPDVTLGNFLVRRYHENKKLRIEKSRKKAKEGDVFVDEDATNLPDPMPFSTPELLRAAVEHLEKRLEKRVDDGLFHLSFCWWGHEENALELEMIPGWDNSWFDLPLGSRKKLLKDSAIRLYRGFVEMHPEAYVLEEHQDFYEINIIGGGDQRFYVQCKEDGDSGFSISFYWCSSWGKKKR